MLAKKVIKFERTKPHCILVLLATLIMVNNINRSNYKVFSWYRYTTAKLYADIDIVRKKEKEV